MNRQSMPRHGRLGPPQRLKTAGPKLNAANSPCPLQNSGKGPYEQPESPTWPIPGAGAHGASGYRPVKSLCLVCHWPCLGHGNAQRFGVLPLYRQRRDGFLVAGLRNAESVWPWSRAGCLIRSITFAPSRAVTGRRSAHSSESAANWCLRRADSSQTRVPPPILARAGPISVQAARLLPSTPRPRPPAPSDARSVRVPGFWWPVAVRISTVGPVYGSLISPPWSEV